MYKQATSSPTASNDTTDSDSKYTVAEILSSMTNTARETANPITPVSFSAGVAPTFPISSSNNLLTPTTFANLERTFGLASQSGDNNTATTTESGFVPPVVNPIVIDPASAAGASNMGVKREYDPNWDEELSSCSSTDPDWNPSSGKRSRTSKSLVPSIDPDTYLMPNSRRPTGPRKERKNEILPPEEQEKRKIRRERNKQAAAKCRQRRVDQTNQLINETENLEEEKAELENEISNLMKQKEKLTFMMEAHKTNCKRNQLITQHQATTTSSGMKTSDLLQGMSSSIATSVSYPSSRPCSLPLRTTQAPASAAPVSITTPSSGISFSHLGLDAMIDGHTGLTPLTTGPAPPTCSSQVQQQHRNSSDGSSNSPSASPSTSSAQLISL